MNPQLIKLKLSTGQEATSYAYTLCLNYIDENYMYYKNDTERGEKKA